MTVTTTEDILICGTLVAVVTHVPVIITDPFPPPVSVDLDHKLVLGSDFFDDTNYRDLTLLGKEYFIFWNDVSRYMFIENGEWEYDLTNGGFNVLIPGFTSVNQTFILNFK